ncbi:DUF3397 family protein [Oceanobacillus manasiensis]|uniref:DUF3397 family protein n=1 Tax=Oceanobacillus manasiensis TaxID=586413 RepID=UPI0005AA8600|nr:DUF3397 family protein [Oceanobacillus manasiensis]
MAHLLTYISSIFIIAPFLATWLIYLGALKLYKQKRRAFHVAVNISTPLYIIATVLLISHLFGMNVTGVVVIVLLGMMMIIMFLQWKYNMEVILGRALKLLCRICFLLFSFLYLLLIVYGLIHRVFFY